MFTVGQTVETTSVTCCGAIPKGSKGVVMMGGTCACYVSFGMKSVGNTRPWFRVECRDLKPVFAPHVRVPVAEIASEFPQLAGALGVVA